MKHSIVRAAADCAVWGNANSSFITLGGLPLFADISARTLGVALAEAATEAAGSVRIDSAAVIVFTGDRALARKT